MKGHVYKRGKNWSYRFDIEPDPLTGKRRQVERERVQDRARGVEGLPGRDGRPRERPPRQLVPPQGGGGAGRVADPDRALDQAVHGAELAELRRLLRDPLHRAARRAGDRRRGLRRAVRQAARRGPGQGQAEEARRPRRPSTCGGSRRDGRVLPCRPYSYDTVRCYRTHAEDDPADRPADRAEKARSARGRGRR